MKIGILTFHRSHNYGALLQGYALKQYLSSLGNEVEFVDFWPEYHQKQYKLAPKFVKGSSLLSRIKASLLFTLDFYKIKKRRESFLSFIEGDLSMEATPKFTKGDQLRNIDYDLVFFGSDQIWRYFDFDNFKGYNEIYYGKYPLNEAVKVSYAASMGSISQVSQNKSFLQENLENFDLISVREDNLKFALEELFQIDITKVVDPVFLLDKKQWEKMIKLRRSKKAKYLLYYNLIVNQATTNYVEILAENMGLEIIELRSRVFPFLSQERYDFSASPIDFMSLVYFSDFVVTSSFHGMAFSIIFNKEFIATGMGMKADRVKSLLGSLDISDRYVEESEQMKTKFSKINYVSVEKHLNLMKDTSKEFIDNALKLV